MVRTKKNVSWKKDQLPKRKIKKKNNFHFRTNMSS